MADKNLDLLHVRAASFKKNLETPGTPKNHHVTKQLADNFNRLLADVTTHLSSDEAAHLPGPITFVSDASIVAGKSDVIYSDLAIMVDQVIGIVDHLRNTR